MTKLRQRDRSEIKRVKEQAQAAWRDATKRRGSPPLPERVVKMIGHLGNENQHERLTALKMVEKELKASGQSWADVANRLK